MRAKILFAFTAALSVTAFACAANTEDTQDPAAESESEQDLTAAAKQISGAWHIQDDKTLDAFVFHTDGTFVHDQFRILNGVLVMGGPPPGRDTGKFTVSAKKGTITLHVNEGWHKGETQVYDYTYKPARILNGVFLPGHEPTATLALTRVPAHPSLPAMIPVTYKHIDSWCMGLPNVADADCNIQRTEKTWIPEGSGVSTCNVSKNSCETKFIHW
jgi:hypothetical protein